MSGKPVVSYPRVYRVSRGWLISLTLFGFLCSAGGIAGAWQFATRPAKSTQSPLWLAGLFVTIALFGIYCLLSTLRSRIVLFPDRIEIVQLTHTTVLNREEIRGWRLLTASAPGLVFEPRDPSRRTVKTAQIFRLDPEFWEWLDTLPCLDREEARNSKAEARTDPRLGANPGERIRTLTKGRRFGKQLTIVTVVVMLWGIVPIPYPLAIFALASLPWIAVAIVKRWNGVFRIDGRRQDVHPNVALPFLFPGLILLLRAVNDYNLIGSFRMVWMPIGIAALLSFAAFSIDDSLRGRTGTLLAIFGLSLAYGYGLAVEVNGLFDRSPGITYRPHVQDKRIVRGRSTTYQLELEPWGPRKTPNRLKVGRSTYDPIQRGNLVVLVLRPGALGVNWYYLRAWERGEQLTYPLLPRVSAARLTIHPYALTS